LSVCTFGGKRHPAAIAGRGDTPATSAEKHSHVSNAVVDQSYASRQPGGFLLRQLLCRMTAEESPGGGGETLIGIDAARDRRPLGQDCF
jgi:hypothetical protein